ncbi:uncharacterized protein LOC142223793 isoform X2 [Haematobia irritans]|uniref:uncharacterized protein LOC142223793 isoform X2 n=1 Tax=Haematobia irritans TaxID=7368 RepID=UPI003F50AE97
MPHSCRICLQKGDINIWSHRVKMKDNYLETLLDESTGENTNFTSVLDMFDIFNNSIATLELSDVFPALCCHCLNTLKDCFNFYRKIKTANSSLKNLYDQYLETSYVEEHLIEESENELETTDQKEMEETPLDEEVHSFTKDLLEDEVTNTTEKERNANVRKSFDENSSLVVTQLITTALEPAASFIKPPNERDGEDIYPFPKLLTVDCKAVEIKDMNELGSFKTPSIVNTDERLASSDEAIYMCQYCPQAFTKSDFLKTHVLKTHVCNFCTQAFKLATDLYRHIRESHSEHRCVICQKVLSSTTNLRHHIKRIHQIKLPPKVTLLDIIETVQVGQSDDATPAHQFNIDYSEFDSSIYFTTDVDTG